MRNVCHWIKIMKLYLLKHVWCVLFSLVMGGIDNNVNVTPPPPCRNTHQIVHRDRNRRNTLIRNIYSLYGIIIYNYTNVPVSYYFQTRIAINYFQTLIAFNCWRKQQQFQEIQQQIVILLQAILQLQDLMCHQTQL